MTEFHELTEILTRAAEMGSIGNKQRIEPSRLVAWALETGINVPEALATAFPRPATAFHQDHGDGDLQSSRAVAEGSPNRAKTDPSHADLEKQVHDLKSKLQHVKSSNTTWRKTTLRIIYGLLHVNLPGRPRDQPVGVGEVVEFLDKVLTRHIDANTVRARITEVQALLPELEENLGEVAKQERAAKERN